MTEMNFKEAAVFIREDLRLKTFPVAAGFLKNKADLPEKARRPLGTWEETGNPVTGDFPGRNQ